MCASGRCVMPGGMKDMTPMKDMTSSDQTPKMDMSGDMSSDMKDMSSDMKDMGTDTDMMMADMSSDMTDMASDMMPDMPNLCGNLITDPGENCDGNCPTTCDDRNACTVDVMFGSAATCDLACDSSTVIDACGPADGCCPSSACTEAQDPDCALDCTQDSTWPQAWKDWENQAMAAINARRIAGTQCGGVAMPPQPGFTVDPRLRQAARCHSLDQILNGYVSAKSKDGSRNVGDFINDTGYVWGGAGIAVSNGTMVQVAVNAWFNSESSCKRLMAADKDQNAVGYASNMASEHRFTAITAKDANP